MSVGFVLSTCANCIDFLHLENENVMLINMNILEKYNNGQLDSFHYSGDNWLNESLQSLSNITNTAVIFNVCGFFLNKSWLNLYSKLFFNTATI